MFFPRRSSRAKVKMSRIKDDYQLSILDLNKVNKKNGHLGTVQKQIRSHLKLRGYFI